MLDIYADWCASCQEMKQNTFSDLKVLAALSQVVLLQVDVTKNSTTDYALLKQFDLVDPPAILFFGSDQLERKSYRIVGYMKADEFLTQISQVFQ